MIPTRNHLPVALVVVLLAVSIPTAIAQVLDRPTLFRLDRTSTFQRGCFPPCMCPIMEAVPIAGTFRLELVSVGDVFDFYEVKNVRWKVRRNTGDLVITGSGTYKVSTIADLQEMSLQLVVGDEPPTVYQSDTVPGGASFPKIVLPISIHGGYCFDTVIELRARPARRLHVDRNFVRWDPESETPDSPHDVVQGDLAPLLASEGGFEIATRRCLADGLASNSLPFADSPEAGQCLWFLERNEGGSYDDGDASQVGSADAGIAASVGACH